MPESSLGALIGEALAGEAAAAQAAGASGYMARVLAQATMPHSDPGPVLAWGRRNGLVELYMQPGVAMKADGAFESVGLPYGSIPRLLMAWVTTEAVRTKRAELVLGETLQDFLNALGLARGGGPRGDITRLRTQARRLFAASVHARYQTDQREATVSYPIATRTDLWWDPKAHPDQLGLLPSTVTLGVEFFAEITDRPIPVDLSALRALKRSPLALDLYTWLTYRYSYLRSATTVPWEGLLAQFGADYKRVADFKPRATAALTKVAAVYPGARFEPTPSGLLLRPSATHVPRLGGSGKHAG